MQIARVVSFLPALLLFILFNSGLARSALAQTDPFYKGKSMRIIVGLSTGGGYDRAARLMAKYLNKHIPGNPDVIVQNMPGASSVTAANYVWAVAQAGRSNASRAAQ